jgi:hypothetical protein
MLSPDRLFDRLLLFNKLIGYAEAYAEIVGPRPSDWKTYVHNDEVTDKARESSTRIVQGLPVQLDALIVDRTTRRPGQGHFRGKPYTEAQWVNVFGNWTFEEIA